MVQTAFTLNLLQNPVRAQLVGGQQRVGLFPDARRGVLIQQFVDAEVALQLQVRPVVQRIAQRVRHRARPGQELLVRRRVAGAVALRHAVGPHGAPLVVVAFQPDLEQIPKTPVLGDVPRREMAMVVEDRLALGILVIKPPGSLGAQEEILVDERHGN